MKCYNHSDVEAVGVCKSCGRALCRECIAEVGLSLSCKSRCESVVAAMNDLVERGSTAYQKTSATYLRNGIFISLLGILFSILGVLSFVGGDRTFWSYFLMIAGLLFLSLGVSSFVSAKKFRQK